MKTRKGLLLAAVVAAGMTITPGAGPATADSGPSSSTQAGQGSSFELFGAAKRDLDPENPSNEVISFDTTDPSAIAGVVRELGNRVKVRMLDNQVEVKYHYVGRSCGGGSTRFQLGIDGDGDGKFDQFPGGPDQNAFGYLGDKPFGGGCLANQWIFEDMTNAVPKWDLSQFGGPMTTPWEAMETFFDIAFPNHQVLNVVLVDDSGGFVATNRGCAYFDLVSAGGRTVARHADTGGDGKDPNNC